MAKVTITITDMEDGNAKVHAEFDPVLTSTNPEDLTPAQYTAVLAISAVYTDEELIPATRTLQ